MRRHPKLIPLSRDHHQQLLLARLLRDDAPPYKGLPTDPEGKLHYAIEHYHSIQIHFDKEDQLLASIEPYCDPPLRQIISNHLDHRRDVRALLENLSTTGLNKTGQELEKLIRYEERILFQTIQSTVDLDNVEISY